MRIELTQERYATLCAKAKESGLMKRTLIERLLEGAEIVGHENSAAKRPERVRRFCKAVPGKSLGTLGRTLLWVSTKALPLFRRAVSPN